MTVVNNFTFKRHVYVIFTIKILCYRSLLWKSPARMPCLYTISLSEVLSPQFSAHDLPVGVFGKHEYYAPKKLSRGCEHALYGHKAYT